MFDGYEDYFTEPSDVDTIIQRAQADIAALFSEKVKQTLDEAAEAEKRLSRLQSEIRSAQYQLIDIESKIKDAQERCDNAELFDIPRRYIQKFVRDATGDYAPGDTVWKIADKGKVEPCCTCGGAKKVKAILGNQEIDIACPECGGQGFHMAQKQDCRKTEGRCRAFETLFRRKQSKLLEQRVCLS